MKGMTTCLFRRLWNRQGLGQRRAAAAASGGGGADNKLKPALGKGGKGKVWAGGGRQGNTCGA